MGTPKNCRECKNNKICQSYYGGSMCKHKEEINRETIRKIVSK